MVEVSTEKIDLQLCMAFFWKEPGYGKTQRERTYMAPLGLIIIVFDSGVRRGQKYPFIDHYLLQSFAF